MSLFNIIKYHQILSHLSNPKDIVNHLQAIIRSIYSEFPFNRDLIIAQLKDLQFVCQDNVIWLSSFHAVLIDTGIIKLPPEEKSKDINKLTKKLDKIKKKYKNK